MIYCQPAPDYAAGPGSLPDHRHHAAALAERRRARGGIRRAHRTGVHAARHLRRRLQLDALRRRNSPANPVLRNFHDPYEREWRERQLALGHARPRAHGLRAAAARDRMATARGMARPSFQLEDLAAREWHAQRRAHDALSDVARRSAGPPVARRGSRSLWDYCVRAAPQAPRRLRTRPARPRAKPHGPMLHVSGLASRPSADALAVMCAAGAASDQPCDQLVVGNDPGTVPNCAMLELDGRRTPPSGCSPRSADLPEGVARFAIKGVHAQQVAWWLAT